MQALNRKLIRDLGALWSQAFTIALVVASGIAGFITTLSAVDSLVHARDEFYQRAHFADVFTGLKRAPLALQTRIEEIPGVLNVKTGIEQMVRIELPGSADPIVGQLIGMDDAERSGINQVVLRRGQPWLASSHSQAIDCWVSEGFANARQLTLGSELTALINGKRRTLRVVGIALSPEYIFATFGGMPDLRNFGVFWVDRRVLESSYDLGGAFNRVAIQLSPNASEVEVRAALDLLTAPYGGNQSHGRQDQFSHRMLTNEIKEQHVLGTVLPTIFLGVASFLLNVVIARLVATQREQIAALKALGYGRLRIGGFYLQLVLVIVGFGAILGLAMGKWLGAAFTRLYAEFFYFPEFNHVLAPWLIVVGVAITLLAAVLGTVNPILAITRLAPAQAMRPPAPGHYRQTWIERLGLHALPTMARMILRNLERRPLRSALSILGVAAALAIMVLGNCFRDAIATVVDSKFNLEMRSDAIAWTPEAIKAGARREIENLPGVLKVEPMRDVLVQFALGHRRTRGAIQGIDQSADLIRVVDVKGQRILLRDDGILMSDRLAEKLHARVGDVLDVTVLEGNNRILRLPLVATVQDMMGLNAFMERRRLNRLLGEDDLATQFAVSLERGSEPAFLAAALQKPTLAGVFSKSSLLGNMQKITERNIRIMSTILTGFACLIAIGVVYNNVRIALAERTWEFASLRVIGFSRAEVSTLLLGEMTLLLAIALPLGMLLGRVLVTLIMQLLRNEQFFFPVTIQPHTYAFAAVVILATAVLSALVVRRRIDRLDLVAALKTRE